MAARLFSKFKEHLLSGNIDLLHNTIVALLVSSDYVPDVATDESRAAIPSSAIIAEATLRSVKVTQGVFDADDTVFFSVEGKSIARIILVQDSDIYSQALLIAVIDDAPQLPVTPDGTNITIQWDNTSNKIFRL